MLKQKDREFASSQSWEYLVVQIYFLLFLHFNVDFCKEATQRLQIQGYSFSTFTLYMNNPLSDTFMFIDF